MKHQVYQDVLLLECWCLIFMSFTWEKCKGHASGEPFFFYELRLLLFFVILDISRESLSLYPFHFSEFYFSSYWQLLENYVRRTMVDEATFVVPRLHPSLSCRATTAVVMVFPESQLGGCMRQFDYGRLGKNTELWFSSDSNYFRTFYLNTSENQYINLPYENNLSISRVMI